MFSHFSNYAWIRVKSFLEFRKLYLQLKQTEAATGGVLWKKWSYKILSYSLENTCVGVSFQ